jgi:hypothetical protein
MGNPHDAEGWRFIARSWMKRAHAAEDMLRARLLAEEDTKPADIESFSMLVDDDGSTLLTLRTKTGEEMKFKTK